MKLFHITNGDSAANLLRQAGLDGAVLPWRDVLHEGPVPAELSVAELAELRSRFIASRGWAELEATRRDFATRDAELDRVGASDRVVLWFEQDLYDQLQLIQILDRLADRPVDSLEMIVIGDHPAVESFHGLGQLDPNHLRDLFPQRQPMSSEQLDLARDAWRTFRSPSPQALADLAKGTPELPFLAPALRRHLEQFPSVANGLGRTEHQALAALASGPRRAAELFLDQQEREEAPFLGDSTFWDYLKRLAEGREPLLRIDCKERFGDSRVTLTAAGGRVLRAENDQIELNGIDRWFGGVYLEGHRVRWRWGRTSLTER